MTSTTPRNHYFPHKRVFAPISGDSLTKQAHKDETDINHILRKAEKGLLVTHLNQHQGNYGNFIDAQDYHTSLNLIHEATDAFMSIPADVRAKFSNDPQEFLEFAQDPENIDAMREMGLAPPPTPEEEALREAAETAPETPPEPVTEAPTAS